MKLWPNDKNAQVVLTCGVVVVAMVVLVVDATTTTVVEHGHDKTKIYDREP